MFRMGSNADDVVQILADMTRSAIPAATADALTWLAYDTRTALVEEMKRVFDRPTNTTLRAFLIDKATVGRLSSRVWLKDEAPKGTPPVKYLRAQIQGGRRRYKKHEVALSARGILPAGMYCTPGPGAPLDAFGNLPGSYVTRMLSDLAVGPDAHQWTTKRSRSRNKGRSRFYVARASGGPAVGIAERQAGERQGKLVLLFIRAPNYRAVFDLHAVGRRVIAENQAGAMRRALRKHLKTVRP